MTGKPLVFDNTQTEINAKHILASSGYPIYGFPWVRSCVNTKVHTLVKYLCLLCHDFYYRH